MPWNMNGYPPAMSHLSPRVRSKAIEIANALLEEGNDEGKSIRVGITQAKRWARAHAIEDDAD